MSPATLDLGCNNAAKASSKPGRLRGWQDSRTMGKNWEQRCRQRRQPWARQREREKPSDAFPKVARFKAAVIIDDSVQKFVKHHSQTKQSSTLLARLLEWGTTPGPGEITWEWSLSFSSAVPPDKSQRCCLG